MDPESPDRWDEITEALRASVAGGVRELAWRSSDYSLDEVLGEVSEIVRDAWTLHRERPGHPLDIVLMTAGQAARLRDHERARPMSRDGLGGEAEWFAKWLVHTADGSSPADRFALALDASSESGASSGLGKQLRELIAGTLSGEISDEQFLKIVDRAKARASPRVSAQRPCPTALPLSRAGQSLREMLCAGEGAPASGAEIWEVFQRFALTEIVGDAPEWIDDMDQDGDVLRFEWDLYDPSTGKSEPPLKVFLVRMFTVMGSEGAYDRLEDVTCTVSVPLPADGFPTRGSIGPAADRAQWRRAVEASVGFQALTRGEVISLSVDQHVL